MCHGDCSIHFECENFFLQNVTKSGKLRRGMFGLFSWNSGSFITGAWFYLVGLVVSYFRSVLFYNHDLPFWNRPSALYLTLDHQRLLEENLDKKITWSSRWRLTQRTSSLTHNIYIKPNKCKIGGSTYFCHRKQTELLTFLQNIIIIIIINGIHPALWG